MFLVGALRTVEPDYCHSFLVGVCEEKQKARLLQWLVFFRQFNAIGPLFVHYALLP